MQPKCGDCLVLWNMPWWGVSAIDWASDSQPAHHCALVLPSPTWINDSDIYVYDAWPPRSRIMLWPDYNAQMTEWSENWRYRHGRKPLLCKLWRFDDIDESRVQRLRAAAQALLDIRYNMVVNWAIGSPAINCSEFMARATVAAHMTEREDYRDKQGNLKRLDQATPWEVEQALERRGARHVYDFDGRTWTAVGQAV